MRKVGQDRKFENSGKLLQKGTSTPSCRWGSTVNLIESFLHKHTQTHTHDIERVHFPVHAVCDFSILCNLSTKWALAGSTPSLLFPHLLTSGWKQTTSIPALPLWWLFSNSKESLRRVVSLLQPQQSAQTPTVTIPYCIASVDVTAFSHDGGATRRIPFLFMSLVFDPVFIETVKSVK